MNKNQYAYAASQADKLVQKNENLSSDKAVAEKTESVSSPSSPSSPRDSGSEKETSKIASKAFGYIQRSIELLGKESNRLAGARDFSNTLHWTQAMKFLKDRGYIYTKTGHGTSVAEQYQTLGGLEKSFHDQFSLDNFPLPRLSKTHLEKLDTKHFFEEATFNSKPCDFAAFPQYRTFQDYSGQKGVSVYQQQNFSGKPPKVENAILIPNVQQTGISVPQPVVPSRETRKFSAPEFNYRMPPDVPLNPIPHNPLSRRSSAPEVPLPSGQFYSKHSSFDQLTPSSFGSVALPPLTNITSSLPEEQRAPPKTSNIHDLLQFPIQVPPPSANPEVVAQECLQKLRQTAQDAMLLQNFSEQVLSIDEQESSSRKRLPPASSSFEPNKEPSKKAKLDYHRESESQWRPALVAHQERY